MNVPIRELKQRYKINLALGYSLPLNDLAAEQDPRQARMLADLLIELTVGIDADVARRLVRGQSGRRGRRYGV